MYMKFSVILKFQKLLRKLQKMLSCNCWLNIWKNRVFKEKVATSSKRPKYVLMTSVRVDKIKKSINAPLPSFIQPLRGKQGNVLEKLKTSKTREKLKALNKNKGT